MTPSITHNDEYLTLDGPFGPAPAIALGLALLLLFAWTLWRERSVLGPRPLALFWCLRSAALAAVIWMLLSPANVRVETSTTKKAVVFLTDVSASMQTVDPPGTSDDLRWAVTQSGSTSAPDTQAADKAVVDAGIAESQIRRAIAARKDHQPEREFIKASLTAQQALQRARDHVQVVVDAADGASEARSLARRIGGLLAGPEFLSFEQICNTLDKGKTPTERGWQESLPDLQFRIAGLRQTLQELARICAAGDSSRTAERDPSVFAIVRSESRVGRAAAVLDRLRRTSPIAKLSKADVVLDSFDESVSRLSDDRPLADSLKPIRSGGKDEEKPVAGTNLSAALDALKQIRENQPLAAAVILTDAAHNLPGATHPKDAAAKLPETPVYVVPIGNSQHVKDVILQNVSAPKIAMRNDDIVVEVNLQTYDCRDETCTVKLLQDGSVVDFREVAFDSDFASRTIRFERKVPQAGMQTFQVAVDPISGEFTEQNNYDEFEVNVTRSDIQVLLADEMPRWEYRYLSQLFRRDDKIACDELLYHPRMIATGRREEAKTVPVAVDEWNQYDVVILGDLPPEHLPVAAQESLVEYLRVRGGTLVLIAGHEAMPQAFRRSPLEDILPVQPVQKPGAPGAEGYAFRLTGEGRDHPALMIAESNQSTQIAWDFVNQFAPLHEVSLWRVPRPTAHTLISAVRRNSLDEDTEADTSAFLCWQPVGRGRIVYLSGPETYRLRFLRGDQFHHRFWGQLLRWAIAADLPAGSKRVHVRADRTRYSSQQTVRISVRLNDAEGLPVRTDGLNLRLTSADREQTVPLIPSAEIPGEYGAGISSLAPGVYRAEPVGDAINALREDGDQQPASVSFTVNSELPPELTDTRCDRPLAGEIASITGGQVLPPTAVNEVLQLTDLDPIVTESIERKPLWLEWKYLWIVFGCLQTEWIVRKWKGLS